MKAFADDKINVHVIKKMKFVVITSIFSFSYNVFQKTLSDSKIENLSFEGQKTWYKEENAGYQHLLLFHNVFRTGYLLGRQMCDKEQNSGIHHIIMDP